MASESDETEIDSSDTVFYTDSDETEIGSDYQIELDFVNDNNQSLSEDYSSFLNGISQKISNHQVTLNTIINMDQNHLTSKLI